MLYIFSEFLFLNNMYKSVLCTYDGLRRHKQTKHGGTRYLCDQCQHVATNSTDLKQHKEGKHDNIRYFCDNCDYTFCKISYFFLSKYFLIITVYFQKNERN